jgi:CelD/BcsL family acetyltransferase involved in cellulose biosynthesis
MIKKLDLREFLAQCLQEGMCSNTPAQIWLTRDVRDFEAFWPRSNHLGEARCWAFQCANILEVWCDTIGAGRETQVLFVAVIDALNRPLALFPLGIERRLGVRILTFLDGGVSDYNAPVLFVGSREWDAEIVRTVWRGLLKILPPFDIAVLEKIPEHVGDLPNPLMHLAMRPYLTCGYAANLSESWESFAATRLPHRQDSRRQRRRLSELGAIKFEVATTAEEYTTFLDAMIRQKSRRYIETRRADGFERPGYRAFFAETTRRLYQDQLIHLSALKLDDTIIAAHWGYVVGARFYYLMPSYESGEFRRYSTGRILLEHLLEGCFAQGLEVFDFGIGNEEYKAEYCDRVITLHATEIPITHVGRAWSLARGTKRRLGNTRIRAVLKLAAAKIRGVIKSGLLTYSL